MAGSVEAQVVGKQLLHDSTAVANTFVRQYSGGRYGRASVRRVSQDAYQAALDTIEMLGCALVEDRHDIDMPPSRGAQAALRGKHMATSLDWIGLLERVVTNYLYADSGLEVKHVKSAMLRIALLFDSLYRQELDAYRLMHEQLSGWQRRVGTGLLTYLLSGAPVEPATLTEQAHTLGIDPHQPFRAVAFCHRGRDRIDEATWSRYRGRIVDALWRHDERREVLLLDRRGLLLALVPEDRPGPGLVASLDEMLRERELGAELYVSCAGPDETLLSAGTGLHRAVAALEISVHRNLRGSVVSDTDVALDILLAGNESTSRTLVASSVGCLTERPTLLDTLRAYIDSDLGLQRTAELLKVHPNTVVYRLRQIAELTGRDMRSIGSLAAFRDGLVALDVLTMRDSRDPEQHVDLRAALLSGD